MLMRKLLTKNIAVTMPKLPYSPDLAPSDFFPFSKLKTPMKGKHFATIEETEVVNDTKKRISEVFRGLEKTLT